MRSPPDTTDPHEPVLRLTGVSAGYRAAPTILHEISFTCRPGDLFVVTGASGAGKSTLLHLLRTAVLPRHGVLQVFGADAAQVDGELRRAFKRRMGYVAQAPIFLEDRTVFENTALPLATAGSKGAARNSDVRDLLAYLGLAKEAGRRAGELSTGQRRIAAIARALVTKPMLILADEPTAGLAPEIGVKIMRVFEEVRQSGGCLVVTTQDPDAAGAPDVAHWRLTAGRLKPALEAVS
jgi:cell division transport system ATP-binding protein